MNRQDALRSLVRSAHQLGRMAAVETGDRTPVAHWRTLAILKSDGPMRIGELAAASRVSQPGMTRMLATLYEEDLVARIADSSDSRAWQVRLTPKGRAAIDGWHARVGEALEPYFTGLDADDWSALERAAELLEQRTRPLVPTR